MSVDNRCSRAKQRDPLHPARQRGGVIIGVLFFLLVVSILLMGIGSYAVSHQNRAHSDALYANAIYLAEAGVNYEFRKISLDVNQADKTPLTVNQPFGAANTSFTVQCVNRGTTTPWSGPGTSLDVLATGTVSGVSRTIRVSAKGYSQVADFAVFAVQSGTFNGSAMNVYGDVGTNGTFNFNGRPGVTGNVVFNGPGSNWQGADPGGYNVVHNPDPILWPTVDEIANERFPAGGLAWLATHNDNALCSSISNNQIVANGNTTVTLRGKAGGANYYLTRMVFNGNAKIVFDNTNGPINIWLGPSGGTGTVAFNGGNATIKMDEDPSKACRIYSALTSNFTINGNNRLDAGIYAYNRASNGATYGTVVNNGNPTVYGSILSKTVTLNGNPTIRHVPGYFSGSGTGYYGFDNSWVEINGR